MRRYDRSTSPRAPAEPHRGSASARNVMQTPNESQMPSANAVTLTMAPLSKLLKSSRLMCLLQHQIFDSRQSACSSAKVVPFAEGVKHYIMKVLLLLNQRAFHGFRVMATRLHIVQPVQNPRYLRQAAWSAHGTWQACSHDLLDLASPRPGKPGARPSSRL
eukprot:6188254-Pleurochrysis_carterae.AAC.1